MKYRYVLTRDDAHNKLIIKEFARDTDEQLSMMGAKDMDSQAVEQAIAQSDQAVVDILRDTGMYPPESVTLSMVELVRKLFGPGRESIQEGFVDEVDVITPEPPPPAQEEEKDEEDDVDIPDEEILEDGEADDSDDDDMIEVNDDGDPVP